MRPISSEETSKLGDGKKSRQRFRNQEQMKFFWDKASHKDYSRANGQVPRGRAGARILGTCHDSDLLPKKNIVALAKIPAFSSGISPISHLLIRLFLQSPVHLFPPFHHAAHTSLRWRTGDKFHNGPSFRK